MNEPWIDLSDTPLYEEHLLLGALYDSLEDWLLAAPATYGDLDAERAAHTEGCSLCDLSGMSSLLLSGAGVEGFVNAAFGTAPRHVGECSFGAVVTGDGSVTAIPLIARTGDTEFLVWDPSPRGMTLQPWLSFLANIEQDGYKPFAEVTVEDVSSALVPLLVWGPQATSVLGDYVSSLDLLPKPGHVSSVMLDRIACLVAAPELDDNPCYLVFAPPQAARVLWRSLLSFPVVMPMGHKALAEGGMASLPWVASVLAEGRLELALAELLAHGLVRPEGGYVGARGLSS